MMSTAKKDAGIKVDDCWKRIGTWGDRRCPQLADCQHCRNCEVYSHIGRQLLNRSIPAGYTQGWTKILAKPKEEVQSGQVSVFIFRLGPEWFAMPASLLVEVLEVRDVHSIPHRRSPILLGLINVRGEMQLCVSVGNLLGVDKDAGEDEGSGSKAISRMLLISIQDEDLAFHVSEAAGVHQYHPGELQSLPSTLPKEVSTCCKGLLSWEGRHVALLDEAALFEGLIGSLH